MDASSNLWKAENIFYPTAIRKATSTSSEAVSDQHEGGATQSEVVQVGASPGKPLKGGELQDVIGASERMDPEVPKEVAEPVVGAQMPNAEELAILAQPLQAIPLAVVPTNGANCKDTIWKDPKIILGSYVKRPKQYHL